MVTAGLMVSPPEKCRVAQQPRSAFGDYADWLKPVTLFVQPVDLQAPPPLLPHSVADWDAEDQVNPFGCLGGGVK